VTVGFLIFVDFLPLVFTSSLNPSPVDRQPFAEGNAPIEIIPSDLTLAVPARILRSKLAAPRHNAISSFTFSIII